MIKKELSMKNNKNSRSYLYELVEVLTAVGLKVTFSIVVIIGLTLSAYLAVRIHLSIVGNEIISVHTIAPILRFELITFFYSTCFFSMPWFVSWIYWFRKELND